MAKNLPANGDTVQPLGQEESPLEKEMATHCSILAWEILWTEEPWTLQFMGSQTVRYNRAPDPAAITRLESPEDVNAQEMLNLHNTLILT